MLQKKPTKNHTFSNKVAKISFLKTPFKKTATKIKKFYLVQSQSQSKKVNTCFTYFWSSKAHPSQAQCLQRHSRKNTHDHYTPTIFSGKVEQLKKERKKKGNKLLHLKVKVSKRQFKTGFKDNAWYWNRQLNTLISWWKEKGPLCSISFYLQCFAMFH